MGYLIIIGIALAVGYRALDKWLDRQEAAIERNPNTLHRQQMARWVAGCGPDPREVLFCNGVPVDRIEGPELSSLSWLPTLPAPSPIDATTGFWTDTASSMATTPG